MKLILSCLVLSISILLSSGAPAWADEARSLDPGTTYQIDLHPLPTEKPTDEVLREIEEITNQSISKPNWFRRAINYFKREKTRVKLAVLMGLLNGTSSTLAAWLVPDSSLSASLVVGGTVGSVALILRVRNDLVIRFLGNASTKIGGMIRFYPLELAFVGLAKGAAALVGISNPPLVEMIWTIAGTALLGTISQGTWENAIAVQHHLDLEGISDASELSRIARRTDYQTAAISAVSVGLAVALMNGVPGSGIAMGASAVFGSIFLYKKNKKASCADALHPQ